MAVENKTKKPIWKKWWFWVLIVAFLIGGVIEFTEPETEEPTTGIVEPTTEPTTTKEPETEASTETEEPTEQITETQDDTQKFIENVKDAIKGQVGENEYIENVVLKNGDLCIYVDFSKADPTPLTIEDLAIHRTVSITDKILEFEEYDNLWNTITVDFGSIGSIRNDKGNIGNNEYGRFFQEENFELKQE